MTVTPEQDARIAKMTFSSTYPWYVKKVIAKGRTIEELAKGKSLEKILRK